MFYHFLVPSCFAVALQIAAVTATTTTTATPVIEISDGQPQFHTALPTTLGVYTLDGVTLTGGPAGLTGASYTLESGTSDIVISKHTYSLDGDTIIINGTPIPLSIESIGTEYTFDSITFTGGTSGLTHGTAVVTPGGGPVTISSHTFSLGTAGSTIVVNGKTTAITANTVAWATTAAAPKTQGTAATATGLYTLAGLTLTGDSTSLQIDGHTLTEGGAPVTVSHVTIAIPTSATGDQISVDGKTTTLPPPLPQATGGTGTGTSTVTTVTSTDTSAPADFSTQMSSNTQWTANTLITTTVNGHETILPVLVGCKHCGGLHHGIILWGIPLVVWTSFHFPKFPDLPTFHFTCSWWQKLLRLCKSAPVADDGADATDGSGGGQPTATGGPNPTATDGPNPTTGKETTTTKPCTSSHTVSDCTVLCSTTDSTHTCYSTTCATTVASCSVTGATTTTTESGDACGASTTTTAGALAKRMPDPCGPCPQITMPPDIPYEGDDPDDPGALRKRAVPVRGPRPPKLIKRAAAKPILNLGSQNKKCALATGKLEPVLDPAYEGGVNILKADRAGNEVQAAYSPVSRWYVTSTMADTCKPTIVKVAGADYGDYGQAGGNTPTMDHSYEKGWIKSFFASFLDTSDGIACDDFNTIMFGCDVNLLAPIFALTACDAHPYFVGMSETLNNNAKGWVSEYTWSMHDKVWSVKVNSKMDWQTARNAINNKFYEINMMIFAGLTYKADNTLVMVQKTNDLIYKGLSDLDQTITEKDLFEKFPKLKGSWKFADKYKTFITEFMSRIPTRIKLAGDNFPDIKRDLDLIRGLSDKVKPKGYVAAEFAQFDTLYEAIQANYMADTTSFIPGLALTFDDSGGGTRRLRRRSLLEILRIRAESCPNVKTTTTGTTGTNTKTTNTKATTTKPVTTNPTTAKTTTTKPTNTVPANTKPTTTTPATKKTTTTKPTATVAGGTLPGTAASAASVAATASPTAEVDIAFYDYQDGSVNLYQWRVYQGTPDVTINYCNDELTFTDIPGNKDDPTFLPTDQLDSFSVKGVNGKCTYTSPSSDVVGSLSCPGWITKVQCSRPETLIPKIQNCDPGTGSVSAQAVVICRWGDGVGVPL